jgi:hypothetical protein
MVVQTVSHHTNGSESVSTGGTNTQANAPQSDGYQVQSGMHGRVTNDLSQVADTDLITIDGMQITYAMARDFGLVNAHKPDTGLSVGNAVSEAVPEVSKGIETGHQDFDQTLSELNNQVEAGNMTDREAAEYSTAVGQVAMAGMTITEASDTIDGLADGSIDPLDLDQNTRDIVRNLENTVQTASTRSAMSELGQKGFNRIAEIAKGDAEFDGILREYASARALGQAGHTWPEFLAEAEAWSRGNR